MSPSPAAFGLYPSTRSLYVGTEALRAARFRQADLSVVYSDGSLTLHLREAVDSDLSVVEEGPEPRAFMVTGPILATLAHVGANLLASLRSLGIPEGLLEPFECRLKQGGLLLSVHCDDQEGADRARRILIETGAEQVTATV